jgi:hypothetical protein
MVELYAYYVGQDHTWRYNIAGNSWAVLPTVRPVPVGTPFSGTTHQWAVVGSAAYALLEDGKLYRATWTATDLLWSGALNRGVPPAPAYAAYQIANVDDKVWILGNDKTITIYDPLMDTVTGVIAVPSAVTGITHVGLCYDGTDKTYAAVANNGTTASDFWVYSLSTGVWTQLTLPSGPLAGLLQPISTVYWNSRVYSMDGVGTLLYYDPTGAIWSGIDEPTTGFAFGGWLFPLGDSELGIIHSGGFDNQFKEVSSGGVMTTLAAPLAVPVGVNIGAFSVYSLIASPPFPATVWPVEVTLPKEFSMIEVPGVRGAIAAESVRGTPVVRFAGKLTADDGGAMRTLIEAALTAFLSPMVLEILPGRIATCYVFDHTLDPKWVGVNDTLVEFSFTVKIPDARFYDYAGNGYFLP